VNDKDMKKLLEIGVQLSSEQDLGCLLERILTYVMELAHCDAGTLYLLQNGALRFRILRNDTLRSYSGGDGQIPNLPPVPLTRQNVCALAVLDGETISIEDVRTCDKYDLTGPKKYDAITGYSTRSMLVVPMHNRGGEAIGVLQLLNAMDPEGQVRAFPPKMTLVLESLASQAAITIQNVRYIQEIKRLLYSFVRVMSSAIDERTPYNANHSRRMAVNGGRFADWLNAQAQRRGEALPFPPQHKAELVMSILLHDIGKITTPLEVMDKAKRLPPLQEKLLQQRLSKIGLLDQIRELKGEITPEERQTREAYLSEATQRIAQINAAGFVTDEQLEWLSQTQKRTYIDEQGQVCPWITDEEYEMLSIRRGTLSPEERRIMENHAAVTRKLLSQIEFSKEFSHVPVWAAAHHELLDGSGYPDGLTAKDIPFEVRIITILDIFDALVADDRPYKPGMPVERALDILSGMAREGKLDTRLTELFTESRCWEDVGNRLEGTA